MPIFSRRTMSQNLNTSHRIVKQQSGHGIAWFLCLVFCLRSVAFCTSVVYSVVKGSMAIATPKRWRKVYGAMINIDTWEWRSPSILSRWYVGCSQVATWELNMEKSRGSRNFFVCGVKGPVGFPHVLWHGGLSWDMVISFFKEIWVNWNPCIL